ncbi:MAG: hypothetical protein ACKPKO_27985, partial [Candidatus Fonsibacter sp.]
CEPVLGYYVYNVRSSGSAEKSAATTRKNQERFLDNLAKGHVRAYVKLRAEPTHIAGVKLAVSQPSVSTIHGQERRNVCMIAISVDNLGELEGRVRRRPPVELDVLRKLVQ